jgi:hypothetical protein
MHVVSPDRNFLRSCGTVDCQSKRGTPGFIGKLQQGTVTVINDTHEFFLHFFVAAVSVNFK